MKRVHRMPFGAELLPDEGTRFRLWAPGARWVEVVLSDRGGAPVAMEEIGGGFWGTDVEGTPAGSRYRFRIDGEALVPDPASRSQPEDVHGPSAVVDPGGWEWTDGTWRGRPWEEAVFYEIHVGTFSPEGSFRGVQERLGYLHDLGVTAIELMPVADFPGDRNWGYDGVLMFAPDAAYGGPDGLKALVEAAHGEGIMVFLDVVYNHFGPDGNYLHLYAPQFFSRDRKTPWGAAINFDGQGSGTVRAFMIHNALYWLEEYHVDGLRLDAVHAIRDTSTPDILEDLACKVADGPGRNRHVHLVLENDGNRARYLARGTDGRPRWYAAQWNDDVHHAAHVIASGETAGYYADYAESPISKLGRGLSQGFIYQGEASPYRGGEARGEPSRHLPQTAFVNFLQNHDQVGNRAFGERFGALAPAAAVHALTAVLLLAPSPPLLFMGQEWNASSPFLFFCDFGPDLAPAVTKGRREEFSSFPEFADPAARSRIPDPGAEDTFLRSHLDWDALTKPAAARFLRFSRELLAVRHREIVPRLRGISRALPSDYALIAPDALRVRWDVPDGTSLVLVGNFGEETVPGHLVPRGRVLVAVRGAEGIVAADEGDLTSWSVRWVLKDAAVPWPSGDEGTPPNGGSRER